MNTENPIKNLDKAASEKAPESKVKKYAALIIVGILAVTMIGFGFIGSMNFGSDYIAKVGDKKITPMRFKQQLESQKAMYINYFGYKAVESMLNSHEFAMRTLNHMIDSLLISKMLEDNGVVINELTVKNYILNSPQFKDENGNFSKDKYMNQLSKTGLSEEAYMAEQANTIGAKFLMQIFDINDAAIIDKLAISKLIEDRQKRMIEVRKFKFDEGREIAVSEEEIQDFYSKNKEQFVAPEEREVLFTKIDAKSVHAKISKEEIEAEYRKLYLYKDQTLNFYKFSSSSQVEAEHFEELLKKDNLSFVDAMKEIDKNPLDSYFKGINFSEMDADFKSVISMLKEGEVSNIFYSGNSYHIIKLDKISKAKAAPPLNKVLSLLEKQIDEKNACSRVIEAANRISDELESGSTLQESAGEVFKFQEVTISKEKSAGLPASIINKILDDSDLGYGKVIELSPCEFYAYQIQNVKPEDFAEISTVREKLISEVKKQKSEAKAREEASKIYLESMEDKTALKGGQILITKESTHYPKNSLDLTFKAKVGDLISPFKGIQNEIVVLKVVEIIDLNESALSQYEIESKIEELKEEQKNLLIKKYLSELRKKYNVKINKTYI